VEETVTFQFAFAPLGAVAVMTALPFATPVTRPS
jgi:hypothetical protein